MHKGRLEAFSDAVIAIIMTIMVLELKVPHGERWGDLRAVVPVFLSYVLSFLILGIYWNNHHHMLQVIRKVNGPTLWANLHLLFWLSLVPFTTAWMGENHFAAAPVALYGMVLLLSGLAYNVLVRVLLVHHGRESTFALVASGSRKGTLSSVLYLIGVAVAFPLPMLALGIYWLVALLWLIPDPKLERAFEQAASER